MASIGSILTSNSPLSASETSGTADSRPDAALRARDRSRSLRAAQIQTASGVAASATCIPLTRPPPPRRISSSPSSTGTIEIGPRFDATTSGAEPAEVMPNSYPSAQVLTLPPQQIESVLQVRWVGRRENQRLPRRRVGEAQLASMQPWPGQAEPSRQHRIRAVGE